MRYSQPDKPTSVQWALGLFWLTIGLGVAKLIRTLLASPGEGGYSLSIFAFLAIYSVMTLTVLYISMAASWARGLMLFMSVIGVWLPVPLVFAHFSLMPLAGTLTLVQAGSQAVGLYLVYRQPGTDWFIKPQLD